MNKFYCGAAKVLITPPAELIPNFCGLTLRRFDRVYDDLYVRVIAMRAGEDMALIVSFDLDKAPCPVEFVAELSAQTGVPEENILYFGIHTHTAPITGYRPFEVRNDITKKTPEEQYAVHTYEKFILERLLSCAREALDSLKPARYGCGYGKSMINVNRTYRYSDRKNGGYAVSEGWGNIGEEADHTLFMMEITELSGKPIAFFTNYAMHNVCMFLNDAGAGKSAISSDIGGNVSKQMEALFDGAICIWSSGAAGDVNCIWPSVTSYPDPESGMPEHLEDRALERTAQHMRVLTAMQTQDILDIHAEIKNHRETAKLKGAIEYAESPYSENALFTKEYSVDPKKKYRIRLHMLKIEDIVLVGADGELYTEVGKKILDAIPYKYAAVINHECSLLLDNPAYVYSDAVIELAQKSNSFRLPGWDQFRGTPGTIGPALQGTMKKLLEK